jgi:hypothetical protein
MANSCRPSAFVSIDHSRALSLGHAFPLVLSSLGPLQEPGDLALPSTLTVDPATHPPTGLKVPLTVANPIRDLVPRRVGVSRHLVALPWAHMEVVLNHRQV